MLKEERLILNILDEITRKYNEVFEENRELINKISYKANHDLLTGVYNRNFFEKQIKYYLKEEIDICIVFIDIDNFKYVNDTFGHEMGDYVLKEFAKILKDFFKGADVISRYGGDEFVVGMLDCDKKSIKNVLQKLIKKTLNKFQKFKTSISIGVSFFPEEEKEFETLVKLADERMYKIKLNGKNGVCMDDEC